MIDKPSFLAAIFVCLFLPLQASAVTPAQPDTPDSFLRHQLHALHIPGMQVAVVRHGEIVFTGNYGIANLQDSVPVTKNTIFPINSITKAFTGVAAMQLVEAGKLDFAAPVSRYLDGLPETWQRITILQLLTHTSGLPDIFDDNVGRIIADNEDDAWKQVAAMPILFAPGEKFNYCQTNYLLLGRIIDKLSGEPFIQFITEKQLKVAAMPSTEFGDAKVFIPHSARDYSFAPYRGGDLGHVSDYTNTLDSYSPSILTAAGMNTTAEEIARWIIALESGRFFKDKANLETLWTPGLLNNGSTAGFSQMLNGYAMGFPVAIRPQHRAVTPIGGGRSAVFIYPNDDLAIVVLTNLTGVSPEVFMDELAGYFVPDMKASAGFGFTPKVKALHLAVLRRGGYEHLTEVLDEAKKQGKPFDLSEDDWETLGRRLFNIGQQRDAVLVLKTNAALHPDVADAYAVLASIAFFQEKSDPELAKQSQQRFLQLQGKKQ